MGADVLLMRVIVTFLGLGSSRAVYGCLLVTVQVSKL